VADEALVCLPVLDGRRLVRTCDGGGGSVNGENLG
jgi:hypothetical protein